MVRIQCGGLRRNILIGMLILFGAWCTQEVGILVCRWGRWRTRYQGNATRVLAVAAGNVKATPKPPMVTFVAGTEVSVVLFV